jgi:tetratricopeptide (TPR) repeat protein
MISFSACASTKFYLAALTLAASLSLSGQTPPNSDSLVAANVPPPTAPAVIKKPQISLEMRGDILMARKMYREAIDTYRQAPPNSPIITNKIGIAFHQLQLLDLAKKNYEQAVKLDKKYSEAINNLGTIYYSQKSYRRAIGYYKKAIRIAPETASVYANLGAAYFGRKDYKHAAEYYEKALKLDPDVFEHHSSFGTLMQQRTVEERATYHLYLAKMYAKNGANDRALIYLRKALEEGVKDREKIPGMPEFAVLRNDPAFSQLMAENPRPL